jgi:hypothetical protein
MKNETRLFPTFILVFVAVLSRLPRSLLGKTWPTKQSLDRANPRIEPGQCIDANDVLERQDRIDDSKPEVAADRHEVGRFSKTAESEESKKTGYKCCQS